jgi:twitching motility two-component system response regulator PilG
MAEFELHALVHEGIAAARAGNTTEARRQLRAATALDERSEAAWLWLAGVAETPAEALTCLERVLAINPSQERACAAIKNARLQAGVAAARADDKPRARELLRKVIDEDTENEMAWLWLASVAAAPAEAVVCLEHVLEINPNNERARAGIERYRSHFPGSEAPEAPELPVEAEADAPVEEQPAGPPRTVLVVDDSPTVRKLVTLTVERHGYRAWVAADGYEAVDLLRERGVPDVILLDISMPGMDGYQLLKLLRQNAETAALPIIMLSGKDGFFSKVRGRICGSTEYLTKPFDPEKLLSVLDKYTAPNDPVAMTVTND